VPPFPCVDAYAVMTAAWGGRAPLAVLSTISDKPVAAASLGQVYKATLRAEYGGGEVAVKVQRPGVLEQVCMCGGQWVGPGGGRGGVKGGPRIGRGRGFPVVSLSH
jgi:hypothetical protein